MTRQQAKRILDNLPIVQAFAEGKTVQSEDSTSLWHDCGNECWIEDAVVTRYRIKPEPREWWAVKSETENAKMFTRLSDAKQHAVFAGELIRVREIL